MVAAYAGAVLITVPVLKNFGCCLIVPGAVGGAMFFYKKLNPLTDNFSVKDALRFSLLTGVLIAVTRSIIDIFLTFIFNSNDLTLALPEMEKLLRQLAEGNTSDEAIRMLRSIADEIEATGFSFLYTIFSLTGNLIMDIIFSIPGGLLARNLLNRREDRSL